jgi:DNA-binding transcriptional ArsR family regulator
VLAALADPTRRLLLERLATEGAASASALARELPVTRQAVAQHLGVLGSAGLVQAARVGREVHYAVRPRPLADTAAWLAGLAARWDERLAAIATIAEGRDPNSARHSRTPPPPTYPVDGSRLPKRGA